MAYLVEAGEGSYWVICRNDPINNTDPLGLMDYSSTPGLWENAMPTPWARAEKPSEVPAEILHNFGATFVGGARRVDVLKLGDDLIGIESKVGRTALDSRVRQELARDWWLRRQRQLADVRWEFSPSEVTGQVGPT